MGSFPLIGDALRVLQAQAGLTGIDESSYVLYGSSLRALWSREACADINLATVALNGGERPVLATSSFVTVAEATCDGPEALVRSADFTVCQIAYSDGAFWFGDRFFEHLSQRLLILNHIARDTAYVSLLRTYKYAQRGYGMTYGEFIRIVMALPPGLAPMDPRLARRHSGGMVVA